MFLEISYGDSVYTIDIFVHTKQIIRERCSLYGYI